MAERLSVSGARGASVTEIARATGAFGASPVDTDVQVMDRFAEYAIERNPGFQSTIPGPADNTYFNLASFKASDISRKTASLVGVPGVADGRFNWTSGNFTGRADDATIIKADSTPLTAGAWVRQQASGIAFRGPAATEKPIDTATLLQTALDVRRFGAKCDGVTNDDTAFSLAVAECLRETYAKPLLIPGPLKVSSTRMIDRAVDSSKNRFRILGQGPNAGFIGGGFTMFDSTFALGGGVDPSSEFVTFDGIRFVGDGSTSARIFSEKFFRMQMLNCETEGVRCMVATSAYAQEWLFENVWARTANGTWFDSQGSFAVRSMNGKYRANGGGIFDLRHDSLGKGVVSCGFYGDTYESNGGSFLQAYACIGLEVSNLYSEGSQGPVLDFSGAFSRSILVGSCEFESTAGLPGQGSNNNADPNYYAVKWGPGGGTSVGNSAVCNMHDNADSGYDGVKSIGDGVTAGKKKFRNDQEAQMNLLPDPSGGYGTKVYASTVAVNPAAANVAHTVALPPPVRGMKPVFMTNASFAPGGLFSVLPSWSADGAAFRGLAGNSPLAIKPGEAVVFCCADTGIYDPFVSPIPMPTVAFPTGGTTIDAEARTQLSALISALRASGRML